jgi:hypothetical protein
MSPKIVRRSQKSTSKPQRAVIAADIFDGIAIYQPSQGELAWLFDVGAGLIKRARQLPPEQRQAVAEGRATLPRPAPSRPKGNGTSADEQTLFNMIAAIGIEKVLTIAAAVEQAQHH